MIRFLVFTMFLFGHGLALGQDISGYVIDSKTREPLPGTSVYLDGSPIGTTTDLDGQFRIHQAINTHATLVISHMGYITKKIDNPSKNEKLEITLVEDVQKLSEVVVTSDPFSRKQKLKAFRIEFLGDTKAAKLCKILNEDSIELFFNTYDNTLTALANGPIVIQNEYLGYRIKFDLNEFKIYFKKKSLNQFDNVKYTLYSGFTQFSDIANDDPKIIKRREKAYLGSSMHFMRSCWNSDWKDQNFTFKQGSNTVSSDQLIENIESGVGDFRIIRFKKDSITINYHKKPYYQSTVQIKKTDTFSIDKYGSYRPYENLALGGYMAELRIGDMLPIDYLYHKTPLAKSNTVVSFKSKKKNKKPRDVKILWDNSLSSNNRNLDKELLYLNQFFKKLGDVQVIFQPFGYELGQEQEFEIKDGDWDSLKLRIQKLINDGATNSEVLEKIQTNDFTLLFTDGLGFNQEIGKNWYGKLYPINSKTQANHNLLTKIAEESGGNYINLAYVHDMNKVADYARMQGNYTFQNIYENPSISQLITVRGHVSDFNDPIEHVLVQVKNTNRKTRTDTKGNFTIQAESGEILVFSYPGRNTVEAVANQGTSMLTITMPLQVNVLDEVVVSEDKRKRLEKLKTDAIGKKKVVTSTGVLDPKKTGLALRQIEGDKLNLTGTLLDALRGTFAGMKIIGSRVFLRIGRIKPLAPAAGWDVDGVVYPSSEPPLLINAQDVARITIMNGSWAGTRYGPVGEGGIIIVSTKQFINRLGASADPVYDQARLRNNYYNGEAVLPESTISSQPKYLMEIDKAETLEEAYQRYLGFRPLYGGQSHFFVDVHDYLLQKWNAENKAAQILSNIGEKFPRDASALRLLAYTYDRKGYFEKACSVYENIHELKPSQLQSNRDLANAYVKSGKYTKAWSVYTEYLRARKDDSDNSVMNKIVRSEMRRLLKEHNKEIELDTHAFSLGEEQQDISIIVEWNNPNAEFELQFVGPEKHYYTWKHTRADNSSLFLEELRQGYFCNSFDIQDIGGGPWMINVNYIGNQENTPTYLKFTVRDNKKGVEAVKILKLRARNVNYQFLNISSDEVSVVD